MVGGFLATSLSGYFMARDSMSSQIAEQALPLTSDNIYSEIQRDLLRPVLISSLMATDTFVRDWVTAGERQPELMQQYLAEIQNRYNTITAFFVSERTRTYYHSTGILRQVDVTTPEDGWYARVREMRAPYEINIDHDTYDPNGLSIFINYRVFDAQGNYIGATGVGLAVSSVAQLIHNYQQRYGRTIYFVDRQGKLTLSGENGVPEGEQRLQERPGLENLAIQILSSPSTSLSYRNAEGDEIYLNSRLVPEFDWHLIVEQNASGAAGGIRHTLWVNVALALGIMAVVLFAGQSMLRTWQHQLEQMATTDSLTGLGNRHLFEAVFELIWKRMLREANKPLSLILLDVDNFKKVNDVWGHQGGDRVLKAVADMLKAHVRDADLVCRWGGEEFLILLENCDLQQAEKLADEIREAAKEMTVPFGREQIQVTISCGITSYQPGEPLEGFMSRADSALYRAKEAGRDRVCSVN